MNLMDQVRIYKGLLQGSAHTLFRGMMVCKVSGVTFDNRQEVLSRLLDDTPVRLVRDRRNEHDFYAVRVEAFIDAKWCDVGFVPSSINKNIASSLDAGILLEAKVWKRVGGEGDFYFGLSIIIKRLD